MQPTPEPQMQQSQVPPQDLPPPPPRADDGTAAWRHDLSASITVFLIAVPLSLGIALATGAPLQSG